MSAVQAVRHAAPAIDVATAHRSSRRAPVGPEPVVVDPTQVPAWAQLLHRSSKCGCAACGGRAPASPMPRALSSGSFLGPSAGSMSGIRIGAPQDAHEQEADRVADQVMRASFDGSAPAPTAPKVQRVATSRTAADHGPAPMVVHEAIRTPGRALDAPTKAFFEPRFGRDLGAVRVHTDPLAAESARAVHAHAYTLGPHIVFDAGRYQPATAVGQRLLAHELTHVLQGGGPAMTMRRDCDDPLFCTPYPNAGEISTAQAVLRTVYLPLDGVKYGLNAMGLFESFLNRKPGDSLVPTVFDDPANDIVQSFATSWATESDQDTVIDLIGGRLSRAPGPLRDDTPSMMSIANFLSPAEMDNRPINFSNPFSIAGHIAGGIGSSDAGNDSRKVSGNVTLERVTAFGSALYTKVETTLHYEIFDAIDFCPGDCGSKAEQLVTVPMSRLEASGEAYDVPFKVLFVPESRNKRFMA